MKHLKKYNESKQDINNLYTDCLDCFADIIDDNNGKVDRFNTKEKEVRLWFKRKENIGIVDTDNEWQTHPSNIDDMIDHEEEYINLLNDVKTGISRLKDIHSGLKIEISCASTLTEIFFSL